MSITRIPKQKIINFLQDSLIEPSVKNVDVDSPELLNIHRSVLLKKPLLHSAFSTFYKNMGEACDNHFLCQGIEVELGSGSGFFKSMRPGLISSDIRQAEYIDMVLDAQNLNLEDNSVRAIYGINVLHHLQDPDQFFEEAYRVLAPGGGFIFIEPHNGFISAVIHKMLHKNEHFEPNMIDWKNYSIKGPLSGANQALPYIIFTRDSKLFEEKYFGRLQLVDQFYIDNWLRYFFSGGVNFKQLLPSFMEKPFLFFEILLKPLSKHLSIHRLTIVKKV
jgi:SAM-dependent methyltransferase